MDVEPARYMHRLYTPDLLGLYGEYRVYMENTETLETVLKTNNL
jgi:hypothetical protein